MFYKLIITLLSASEECLYTLSLCYIKSIKFKFIFLSKLGSLSKSISTLDFLPKPICMGCTHLDLD